MIMREKMFIIIFCALISNYFVSKANCIYCNNQYFSDCGRLFIFKFK